MQRFTYEDALTDIRRREEGLRRAQRDGTAYEYRPKRRISFALPWRKPAAPEAPATNTYGRAEPRPS